MWGFRAEHAAAAAYLMHHASTNALVVVDYHGSQPVGWWRLVLALGSRPSDFAIPGLAQRALSLYSARDAERVWAAVNKALTAAAAATDHQEQRRPPPRSPGGTAWRPTGPPCSWSRRGPPSWPAPHRS